MSSSYESFRQKLGLDYLLGDSGGNKAQQSSAQQFIDAAFQATGIRVISELKRQGDGVARLHDLVGKLDLDLESLLRVIEFLEENQLVTIIHRDNLGNHTVQITEIGKKTPV